MPTFVLPLTASLGHWLSVAQKILSVGQPGFLGRVLKQPFFLFSFNVSLSTKPLTVPALSSVPLLCRDKKAAREAQLPVVSRAPPSLPCHESSALPLLTGTSPLSCTLPAARSLPKRCCTDVFFQPPREVKEQYPSGTDAGVRQLSIIIATG